MDNIWWKAANFFCKHEEHAPAAQTKPEETRSAMAVTAAATTPAYTTHITSANTVD